jgi:O-succinylbenzoic acid--CoA ligase
MVLEETTEYRSLCIEGRHYHKNALKEFTSAQLENTQEVWERDLYTFILEWLEPGPFVQVKTSGTTGEPKLMQISKQAMIRSAQTTLTFFQLKKGDSALLCLPVQFIAGKMMVVRAFVGGLDLIPIAPKHLSLPALPHQLDFAAMVPLQVEQVLRNDPAQLNRIGNLIIGGAAIPSSLTARLQDVETPIWETYGMTETLSHIALRKVNGAHKSNWFTPLSGVDVSLDERGCLCVSVDGITSGTLVSNDCVAFNDHGQFQLKGRADNVINSGGIKVFPEELEQRIHPWVYQPFVVSALPDPTLGEKVVLVIEGDAFETANLLHELSQKLDYQKPREIRFLKQLPRTATGKVKRNEVKEWIKAY